MNKRRKKRKLKIGKVSIFLILLIILVFGLFFITKGLKKVVIHSKDKYISGTSSSIITYVLDDESNLKETDSIIRGTKVKSSGKTITRNDVVYEEISYKDNKYYLVKGSLASNKKDAVLEKEKYVRTPVTIYENEKDTKIKSYAKKGSKLDIIGYDTLLDDGTVNMYNINFGETKGWVFSKYLVDSEEKAIENYNENSVYDTHKDRKYGSRELHGGSAANLDYFPYKKVEFKDNPILKTAKAMYLNAGVLSSIDSYLNIAKNNGVNAIVVDIKDGALAYPSEVAKVTSPTAYNTSINDLEEYKDVINKIKEAGIYAIGRIVVFNDVHYGKDHPDDCIESGASSQLWPSAFARGAWEYNVNLAIEAVKTFGFNEIQFDYVRFPEQAYKMSVSGNTNFKNTYEEEKAQAVQNFLYYATDQIHKTGAYLSVDVFGECSSEYVTAYGQYWPAISNIVDVISSMPYTDHFTREVDTWSNPYKTVYNWALGAAKRQTEIPTPAIERTWVTAYNTPFWNPTVTYDASKISAQVEALYDAGLTGGFITWNSSSSLAKYEEIKSAFAKNYE